MDCSCDSMCKGAGSCTCIFIVSSGSCKCDCGPPIVLPPDTPASASQGCGGGPVEQKAPPGKRVSLDEKINISARDAELGNVAAFIAKVTRTEVLIPASELRKPITIELEDVRLADAIDELNLVAAPPLRH